MKKNNVEVLAALVLVVAVVIAAQQFSAPAAPLESVDTESSFIYELNINTPIKVEMLPSPPAEPGENKITIAASVKNISTQTEEVIYYFDYSSTLTPAFAEKVTVNSVAYNWGQQIPIASGSEQIIVISLKPEPVAKDSDLAIRFRVVRWLGPRG